MREKNKEIAKLKKEVNDRETEIENLTEQATPNANSMILEAESELTIAERQLHAVIVAMGEVDSVMEEL